MFNRARGKFEPEMLRERFGAKWCIPRPMDNGFNPQELFPRNRACIVRNETRERSLDVMRWDVLGENAKFAMTNARNLALPQWRALASDTSKRCLVLLTEFAKWTPGRDPQHGIKGEIRFDVVDQPNFAVAGILQTFGPNRYFAMVTCDPNELVAPIHPKDMITILPEGDWEDWLIGGYDDVVALQRPYPADLMSVRGPVFPTRKKKGAKL